MHGRVRILRIAELVQQRAHTIQSQSPARSPLVDELDEICLSLFERHSVHDLAGEKLQCMRQDGNDHREGLFDGFRATGKIDDERAIAHAGDGAG